MNTPHCHPEGMLSCLDGFMNIALQNASELINGQVKRKYADVFIRGNNGKVCFSWMHSNLLFHTKSCTFDLNKALRFSQIIMRLFPFLNKRIMQIFTSHINSYRFSISWSHPSSMHIMSEESAQIIPFNYNRARRGFCNILDYK